MPGDPLRAKFIAENFLDNLRVGNVFSSDLFYSPEQEAFEMMEKYNILGVEMETAGIYGLTAEFGARALAMCTVSDQIITGERLTI